MRHQPIPKNDPKAKKQPLSHAVGQKLAKELTDKNLSFRQTESDLGLSIGAIQRFVSMSINKRRFVSVNLDEIAEAVYFLGYDSLGEFISQAELEI